MVYSDHEDVSVAGKIGYPGSIEHDSSESRRQSLRGLLLLNIPCIFVCSPYVYGQALSLTFIPVISCESGAYAAGLLDAVGSQFANNL